MLKLNVPAGIGDISWSYSKVADLKEQLDIQISDDGINRSLEFVKLLPGVISAKYFHSNFHCICDHTIPYNTRQQKFLELATKEHINFSPNRFLEKGQRLQSWVPELPTNYHYPIYTPESAKMIAEQVSTMAPVTIGIYCSTYQNIAAWKAWHLVDWVEFITIFKSYIRNAVFVFLGATYDKPFIDDLCQLLGDTRMINLAGKTNTAELIEVLKILQYLVSYPCGIPVLSNVLRKPCLMFYPENLLRLFYAWPDPEMITDLSYKALVFPKPSDAMDFIRSEYKLKSKLQGVNL